MVSQGFFGVLPERTPRISSALMIGLPDGVRASLHAGGPNRMHRCRLWFRRAPGSAHRLAGRGRCYRRLYRVLDHARGRQIGPMWALSGHCIAQKVHPKPLGHFVSASCPKQPRPSENALAARCAASDGGSARPWDTTSSSVKPTVNC